ncbi:MAG TPA: LolA-related protein [Burkholderiales bacterium]|jgi:outer membrane lipoprotein-sorting protein|nr:LolA-related protein [Burkholderiales bacterium]
MRATLEPRRLLLAALAVLTVAATAGVPWRPAQAAPDPLARDSGVNEPVSGLLPEIMRTMAKVKSSRARFVEKKYLAIVNTPLQYTGGLAYNAPDKLEKRTETPKAESMLLEGDKLTLTNARHQTRVVMLSQYPQVRAFTESIRSVLAGDMATLGRYYGLKAEGSIAQWTLLLTPSDPQMQSVVQQIRFSGANHSIRSIEITEKQGDRSVMSITEEGP